MANSCNRGSPADNTMEEHLVQQFGSFQVQPEAAVKDEERSRWIQARARRIDKDFQVLALSGNVAQLTLQEGQEDSNSDDVLGTVLLKYLTSVLAQDVNTIKQGNDEAVVALGLLELVAAMAFLGGDQVTQDVLECTRTASTALMERVRYKACQMFGCLATQFDLLESKRNLQESWMEYVMKALEPRLKDKSQIVRQAAIQSTGILLQRVCSKEIGYQLESIVDNLTELLMWNMWHDTSITNRMEAIQALPLDGASSKPSKLRDLSPLLMDHLVGRLQDLKEKVRLEVLKVLSSKVIDPFQQLSQEQLAQVVKSGLMARCQPTKDATCKLICTHWMKAAKFSPLKLAAAIGVLDHPEECEKALQAVVQTAFLDVTDNTSSLSELSDPEKRAFFSGVRTDLRGCVSSNEDLTVEKTFTSRIACELLEKTEGPHANILNEVIPDMAVLCDHLQKHSAVLIDQPVSETQSLDHNDEDKETFVCLQLLQFATLVGLQEEGSRRRLTAMMKAMLATPHTPDELVEGCVQALHKATASNDRGDRELWESLPTIFDSLSSPMENETLNTHCTLRRLSILSIALEGASVGDSGNSLDDFAEFVLGCITDTDNSALVREAAVSCLGKLGLYSDTNVIQKDWKPCMLQIAADGNERLELRGQALLGLTDWSMLCSGILDPCSIASGTTVGTLDVMKEMLQSTNAGAIGIAAEAAAKVIFSGRVYDSQLVALLLLVFFDPNLGGEAGVDDADNEVDLEIGSYSRFQQALSLFFPAYCMQSQEGRDVVIQSIGGALTLATHKPNPPAGKTRKTRGRSKQRRKAFPLVRMVEYVCSLIEDASLQQNDPDQAPEERDPAAADVQQMCSTPPFALVALQVAQFLGSEYNQDGSSDTPLTVTQTRGLCKLLDVCAYSLDQEDWTGAVPSNTTVASEIQSKLSTLRERIEDLDTTLTDGTSLDALVGLAQSLDAILPILDEAVGGDDGQEANEENNCTSTEPLLGDNDDGSSGETTVEDSLMGSVDSSLPHDKENNKSSQLADKGSRIRGSNKTVLSSSNQR